jgi:hypothetical protein
VLRANAEKNKAYDAYHSTTMEGYRISREISDAIVRGEPLPDGPQDRKTLEAAIRILGRSQEWNVRHRLKHMQPGFDTSSWPIMKSHGEPDRTMIAAHTERIKHRNAKSQDSSQWRT